MINGKFYVGVHITDNLDDGYMGSGSSLKLAIRKYGIDNFKKEYIHIFDNETDMFNMESNIVDEQFVKRNDVYNIRLGGVGSFSYINGNKLNNSKNQYKIAAELIKLDASYAEEFSNKIKVGQISSAVNHSTFLGKKHTDETKKKISIKNSKIQNGLDNSQYGTMWIYNESLQKNSKIKKTDTIPDGWRIGRKMKF
jgi:hypothetical protein